LSLHPLSQSLSPLDIFAFVNPHVLACTLFRYNSITELEIVQASFRKKYDYGYFYFRNSSREKLQDVEPSQHESVLSLYKPESEYAARKLRELKQQTIDTGLQ